MDSTSDCPTTGTTSPPKPPSVAAPSDASNERPSQSATSATPAEPERAEPTTPSAASLALIELRRRWSLGHQPGCQCLSRPGLSCRVLRLLVAASEMAGEMPA